MGGQVRRKRGSKETEQMVQQLKSNWEGGSAGIISQLANTVPQLSSKQYLTECPLKLSTWKGSSGIKTDRDHDQQWKVLLLQKLLFP